jgi:RHS repeat-associated protein
MLSTCALALMCFVGLVACSTPTGPSGGSEPTAKASSRLTSSVQANYSEPSDGQSVTASFDSAQNAGDLNVVIVGWNDATSSITSVTDTSGNTYALAIGPTVLAGTAQQSIYYAKNIVAADAGTNQVTVNFNADATWPNVQILEYAGIDPNSPLDVTGSGTGNGTTASTGNVTTVNSDDLLVVGDYAEGNEADGCSFNVEVFSAPAPNAAGDQEVTTAGNYASWINVTPGWWVISMAAFRVAPAGSPSPAPGTPTGFAANTTASTAITLSWTNATSAQSGVKIERSTDGTNYTQIAIAGSDATGFTDTGLATATKYWYRVRATGAAGDSAYASAVSATTWAGAVQSSYQASDWTDNGQITVTFPGAQQAGDTNVVFVGWKYMDQTIASVTDSAGNSYALAIGPTANGTDNQQAAYYAKNIVAAASNTITVTFDNGDAFCPDVRVIEYAGLDPTSPLDAVAANTDSSDWMSVGPVSASQPGEVIVAGAYGGAAMQAGDGFVQEIITAAFYNLLEDATEPTSGSYTAAAPLYWSGDWVFQVLTLKAAGGPADGTPCDDGNACTQTDTYQSGVCVGGNPITCTASDQCHVAGRCNTSTGVCSNPAATDGTSCNDGNACTQTDTCQSGTCTGANPVTCTASDQCHVAGTCNTSTGVCSNPAATDGTSCNDGNACTQTDTCQSGTCTGSNPVTCTASDQCHVAGTCNTSTGACSNPVAADGTLCDDGNACTKSDVCTGGSCAGTTFSCGASDQCHQAGTCNGDGTCSYAAKADGTLCDDGNACTKSDVCTGGSCAGTTYSCGAPDQCRLAGTCNGDGTCSYAPKADGTSCNDGNACTQTDACQGGTCTGSNTVTCEVEDQCHAAGTCNPSTGACSNPTAADGSSCSTTAYVNVAADESISTGSSYIDLPTPEQVMVTTADGDDLTIFYDATVYKSDCTGSLYDIVNFDGVDQTNSSTLVSLSPSLPEQATLPTYYVLRGVSAGTHTVKIRHRVDTCTGHWVNRTLTVDRGQVLGSLSVPTDEATSSRTSTDLATPDRVTLTLATAQTVEIFYQAMAYKNDCTGTAVNVVNVDGVDQAGTTVGYAVKTGFAGETTDVYSVALSAGTHTVSVRHWADTCSAHWLYRTLFVRPGGELLGASIVSADETTTSTSFTNLTTPDSVTFTLATAGPVTAFYDADEYQLCGNTTFTDVFNVDGSDVTSTASAINEGGTFNIEATHLYRSPVLSAGSHTIAVRHEMSGCTAHWVGRELLVAMAPSANAPGACTAGVCQATCGCDDGNPCTTDVCDAYGRCSHTTLANGTACTSTNKCSPTYSCQNGACTADDPVVCTAPACQVAGTCDPATGICSTPTPVADGTSCTDGNACTLTDVCSAGTCVGQNPVVCSALDQCHVAGTCDPNTGACSNPAVPNGTACNDQNACTSGDTCSNGTCAGTNAVTCTASDSCHVAGTCDPLTGTCSNPEAPDGTACAANFACAMYACSAGACAPGAPVTCGPVDQCHVAATCDPATGACGASVPAADGTACDDGNPCTTGDACAAGQCHGTTPLPAGTVCAAANACTGTRTCDGAGTCLPGSGTTISVDDGNPCTVDTCDPNLGAVNTPIPGCGVPLNVPPLDRTRPGNFAADTAFLYSGSSPVQVGVAAGTMVPQRVAVVRGRIVDDSGALPGVTVTVLGHPEFGSTQTRSDGWYDIAVNGGGQVVLDFAEAGYLGAQRQVTLAWNQMTTLPDVILVPYDVVATPIQLESPDFQVARGTSQTDTAGTRQATVLVPPGTTITNWTPPNGVMTIRATEFTVGANGPKRMPADLPPTSGYTYAVALTIDEAVAAGVPSVQFSQPLSFYVDNFLHFPVGSAVPLGTYDSSAGQWVAMPSGVILSIVSITGGMADIDITGDGVADAPATLLSTYGITDAERTQLATTYPTVPVALWRVQTPHFSTLDLNYALRCPSNCIPPPSPPPPSTPKPTCPSKAVGGSVIDCTDQSLAEDIPVAGTPYTLHYESSKTLGALQLLKVPVTDSRTLPGSLKRIEVEVALAGRRWGYSLQGAGPNEFFSFWWDRKDAYGRLVQGRPMATINVTYVYPALATATATFGQFGRAELSGSAEAAEIYLRSTYTQRIGGFDVQPLGLGGWALSAHHVFDASDGDLWMGDGRDRLVNDLIMNTVAGGGSQFEVDGIPATQASFHGLGDIAVAPDGTMYVEDSGALRQVGPDGVIRTIASCSGPTYFTDGTPASQVAVCPGMMTTGPDGSLYVGSGPRVLRIGPGSGRPVSLVAGSRSGTAGESGDGGPATQALMESVSGLALGPDGTLYVGDLGGNWASDQVRAVSPDGIIRTVAGYAHPGGGCYTGNGDGGPGTSALLCGVGAMDVGLDGSLYFIADFVVRKLDPTGTISTVAGVQECTICGNIGYSGDGGPATSAHFNTPTDVKVRRDGTLFIMDHGGYNGTPAGVRQVTPDGVITTIAGPGTAGWGPFNGDNLPARQTALSAPTSLAIGPNDLVYLTDNGNGRVREIASLSLAGIVGNGDYLVPSPDGAAVFEFDSFGHHVATRSPLIGTNLATFSYDASNLLASITDANSNVTRIDRSVSSTVKITAPFGQVTTLTLDPATGHLVTTTDPLGGTWMTGPDPNGLLQTLKTPVETAAGLPPHTMGYSPTGLLISDSDSIGTQTLTRTDVMSGWQVVRTSGEGRIWTYAQTNTNAVGPTGQILQETSSTTDPASLPSTFSRYIDESRVFTVPDGTTTTVTLTPDPILGFGAPLNGTTVVRSPSGLTRTTTQSRSAVFGNVSDIFSATSVTTSTSVNGNTTSEVWSRGSGGTSTRTISSPAQRQVVYTLDGQERVTQVAVPGITPIQFQYDPQGRLYLTTQGTRTWKQTYDAQGYAYVSTDPLNQTITYTNDALGHPLDTLLPDLRVVHASYDADGNMSTLTLPSNAQHGFSYTPIDLVGSYTPPSVDSNSPATHYSYNHDRQSTLESRPGGVTIVPGYDTAGRLYTVSTPQGPFGLTYDPQKGTVATASAPSGEGLTYAYDGSLPTGTTWSGPVAGSVTLGFDNLFRVVSQKVNNANEIILGYDTDNLLTGAGALVLTPDPQNGLLTGTTLGSTSDSYGYDPNGLLATYTAKVGSSTLYSESIDLRDGDNRIKQKTETVLGTTHVWKYNYDATGRLTDVYEDNVQTSHYEYDADDNRNLFMNSSGSIVPQYDAQDRLKSYGGTSYTYTENGELLTKVDSSGTTTYSYSAMGELLSVSKPDGTLIEYVHDARHRRVGKKVNGVLTKGWLYNGRLRVVAELDGSGNLVSRFVQGMGLNGADYMVKGGTTYRLVKDHLGSVRLVVDSAAGTVVERIDYDEFGGITGDTSPGFQPFGFAGGLYDPDTGLVRFGKRDYDAVTGRWTKKDPIRFNGGQANLYAYVANDPIDLVDPYGKLPPIGLPGPIIPPLGGIQIGVSAGGEAGLGPGVGGTIQGGGYLSASGSTGTWGGPTPTTYALGATAGVGVLIGWYPGFGPPPDNTQDLHANIGFCGVSVNWDKNGKFAGIQATFGPGPGASIGSGSLSNDDDEPQPQPQPSPSPAPVCSAASDDLVCK